MARRVFFSFHYDRDIWRASQVRNSWQLKPDRESAGFWDAAQWEQVKRGGETAIQRWIRDQLSGTSVTVVLIGAETASRSYVQYEIEQSAERGNGLLGVRIHNVKDRDGRTDSPGACPFTLLRIPNVSVYDWVRDDGYSNIGAWIEAAYRQSH